MIVYIGIGILAFAILAASIWVEREHRKHQKLIRDLIEKQKS